PLHKIKFDRASGASLGSHGNRNRHRQAFQALGLRSPDLQDVLIRDDLNKPIAENIRRHPQSTDFISRWDVLLDGRVDRALMDERSARGLDEEDLCGVIGVGFVMAGTQLRYLTGTS